MDFALTANQEQVRDAVGKSLRALRRCLLAEKGQGRRLSRRLPQGAGRCRLARHLYSGNLRRFRSGDHRRRDHDADDFGIRCWDVGRVCRAYERVRIEPGRGVRHPRTMPAHVAADRVGCGKILLRRHRAKYRAQHHATQDACGAQRRQICRQRPEGVDFHRASRGKDLAAGTHHAAGRRKEPDPRPQPVLHGLRSQAHRRARDREDGPQGGGPPTSCLSRISKSRSRIASARRAAASNTSCTA